MAERRMFTRKVTDSDEFISMGSSCQALYLHLCQAADDDGFNNQVQMAMFKAHASIDDLRVLLAKRFILQFENGVIVIKHWRMANTLRKDRYVPTNFQEERSRLQIKENGSYTELSDGCQMVAKWLPIGCQTVAADKDSIEENKRSIEEGTPTLQEVKEFVLQERLAISATRFFNYYSKRSWKDRNGRPVDNWKDTARQWSEQDRAKAESKQTDRHYQGNDVSNEEISKLLEQSDI